MAKKRAFLLQGLQRLVNSRQRCGLFFSDRMNEVTDDIVRQLHRLRRFVGGATLLCPVEIKTELTFGEN
jgi:hypothetical protein